MNLHIHDSLRRCRALLPLLACCLLASCDSAIYDDEGDCSSRFRVSFRYDMNMKYADAFPHEVEAVTLALLDPDGKVVWVGYDDGEPLTREGYKMDVEVEPGRYSLLAWAGDMDQHSFDLGTDELLRDNVTARLHRSYTRDHHAYSDVKLSRLYHGHVADVTIGSGSRADQEVTVPLKKNTNYIKVVLQQVGGAPMDMDDYEIRITDDNGMMEWNNELRSEEVISYRPWHTTEISADISPDDDSADTGTTGGIYSGIMAEFTTARLTEGNRHSARLTVRDLNSGNTIFSVKIIDFLLMVKGEYNRHMTDQEYLDRQDAFDMVFFLDENRKWLNSTIFINSWKVVLQDADFNS